VIRRFLAAVKPEDVERLSPLLLDHVNVLGRYEFALKESLRQKQLRPLREPNELERGEESERGKRDKSAIGNVGKQKSRLT
jgi:hypothetical protein